MKVAKKTHRVNGAASAKTASAAPMNRRILRATRRVFVFDKELLEDWIRLRQDQGIDRYDEVWEGVYVVPPLPNLPHQGMVSLYCCILHEVVRVPKIGRVFPGANVSDRLENWEENYRCPDMVVVLNNGLAIDCRTHFCGGPDFLMEIQSPGDETEEKIGFYSRLKVQELLIIHRDSRQLRLYRHNGQELVLVSPSPFQGEKWLLSQVVPLAFRRVVRGRQRFVEVLRTDGVEGHWLV